jgi:N-formylglutamate amidohydrolase
VKPAFVIDVPATSSVVAAAIHAGHDVRDEVLPWLAIDDDVRLREEDPHTDRIARVAKACVVVARSRFEVDMNRPRDGAVYRTPGDAWGLSVWRGDLPDEIAERSRAEWDAFHDALARAIDACVERRGRVVVLDVHSYNHRRDGPDAPPAPQEANPDVNVGTGSMDRARWAETVDGFIDRLRAQRVGGRALDVRENVRFRGGHLAAWVHERWPQTGCAIALEFKKTFMDEWTGVVDERRLDDLGRALGATLPFLERVGAHA